MQPQRSENHGESFNEIRLTFPSHFVEGNHAGSRKIFHKCADMLIEKNLHMKKNVAAVITKEILITFLWFHALFCLHRLKPVGRRGRFSLAAILFTSLVTSRPLVKQNTFCSLN